MISPTILEKFEFEEFNYHRDWEFGESSVGISIIMRTSIYVVSSLHSPTQYLLIIQPILEKGVA